MHWLVVALFSVSCTPGTWSKLQGGDWALPQGIEATLREGTHKEFDRGAIFYRAAHGVSPPKWGDYSFQYQGIRFKGEPVVAVLAHCVDEFHPGGRSDETKELQFAFDGAACYFRVLYDPATKAFFHFAFNGIG
jgi:hypothetical protein